MRFPTASLRSDENPERKEDVDMTDLWTEPGPKGPWDKASPYPLLPTAPWTTLRVAHMPTSSTPTFSNGRGPPEPDPAGTKTPFGESNRPPPGLVIAHIVTFHWVVGLNRNRWSDKIGLGGRFQPESMVELIGIRTYGHYAELSCYCEDLR